MPTRGIRSDSLLMKRYDTRIELRNPADEGAYTEKGANGLSGLGMLSFPILEGQNHWAMPAYRGGRRDGEFSWPIWSTNGD